MSSSSLPLVTAARKLLRLGGNRREGLVMVFRTILAFIFALGAAACLAPPASAMQLPKEGTCKFKVTVDGKSATEDKFSSWSEIQTVIDNCNHWPPMKRHCVGFEDSGFDYGYCLGKDSDGDSIVWNILPHSVNTSNDVVPSEVQIASGKYKGMTGKSTERCSFSGSETEYTGTCDVEMSYKIR